MGTDVGTAVTLNTVLGIPFGHERGNAALLVSGGTERPGAVRTVYELADGEQVSVLSVDRTHDGLDKLGSRNKGRSIIGKRRPFGLDLETTVLAAAVNCLIVHVHDILTFLPIALHNELLHLLDCEIHGNHLRDAEECALENGVGTVAETDLLGDAGRVYVIYRDIVLREIAFHPVGKVGGEFVALPDGVEQESAVGLESACHIVHVKISLH